MKLKSKILLLIFCAVSGCHSASDSAEIILRNDIQDETFNKIVVDQIHHSAGVALTKYTLSPGEEIPLPFTKIISFQVTRHYQDHTNHYQVACPAQKKGIIIKLIDVHLNRMPSGCLLRKFGEERNGVINWR